VIRGAAAVATQPVAAEAAAALLEAGGSAADAIIAGFFAAAGARPDVLLAPAIALVAGAGAGARAFDGRARQPGLGAPRPRGYVDEASIPEGAHVAAPCSLPMIVLLHTYRGRATLSALARPGVLAAERAGAKARAALLRRAGDSGVLALRSPEVVRPLLAAGGPLSGGILTAMDLEEARPAEAEALATPIAEDTWVFTPPWPPEVEDAVAVEAIVACDARGIIAALAYAPARGGVAVPELELELGRGAIPVRRGVTRTAPGTPLPALAPVALLHRKGGFSAALALTGRGRVEATSLAALASGARAETALAELCAETGGAAIAAVSDGRAARAIQISG
jgi:hypothetical protein